MWSPIKIKSDPKARCPVEPGWYCFDTVSLSVDPRCRYGGKQAAQKACDHRNGDESAKETDGLLRNPKKWFSVGYFDRAGLLIGSPADNNMSHRHDYLSKLLRETIETLQGGHIRGATLAVIWTGRLTKNAAMFEEVHPPIRYVYPDGRITSGTA